MARRSRSRKAEEIELSEREMEELEELSVFVDKFGASAKKLSIYRYNDEGDPEFLKAAANPSSVNEEYLQRTLGAGKYHLVLRDDRGRFLKSRTVVIGHDKAGAPAASPHPALPDPQLAMLREQMAHERAMMLKLIEGLSGNKGPTMKELLESLMLMKQMNGGDGKPASLTGGLKEGLELFGMFNELLGEGADWKTEIVKTVREGLPLIADGMKRPAENAGGTAEKPGGTVASVLLKKGIDFLKPKVLRGSDPLLWRDFILENTEDVKHQALIRVVMSQPFEKFIEMDPDLGAEPYKAWFETLYLELKHALSNVDDPGRPGGDAKDAGSDGGPGAGVDSAAGAAHAGD
jgi:hypothetical protein